ncbi:MAG: hypothetical protein COB04_04020 [Gammaproteobacteria bacterium]|nr:MAG: hypothetical protein COB04_04020 [Gammaproteobacteria bacterium]
MVNALFQQDGNIYTPTEKAAGPWGPTMLHGGSTGGLMAHAMEQASNRDDLQFTRLTLDMFRPVPMAPLTVESRVIRDGKRVQVLEATVFGNGKEVAKGTALKLIPREVVVPEQAVPSANELQVPEELETMSLFGDQAANSFPPGLHLNLLVKRICGFGGTGEGEAWFRMPVPVVEGIENSPFVHISTLSDFGNGLGQLYVKNSTGSINADITLYLHRIPTQEWIGFKSKAVMESHGIGVITTHLFDNEGMVGSISQAIMPQFPAG